VIPVKSEATPRPWKIDDSKGLADEVVRVHESAMRHLICYTYGPLQERQANAALIVECVNSHSALLAQNAELAKALEQWTHEKILLDDGQLVPCGCVLCEETRAALKAAKP
jgi:hypothetical protein